MSLRFRRRSRTSPLRPEPASGKKVTAPAAPASAASASTSASAPTQQSQQPPAVLVGALLRPRCSRDGEPPACRELLASRAARGELFIALRGIARRATARRDGCDRALEQHRAAVEAQGVAGLHGVRGLHPAAIEVDSAAMDRIGRGRPRFEQTHREQPAVDARGARSAVFVRGATHGGQTPWLGVRSVSAADTAANNTAAIPISAGPRPRGARRSLPRPGAWATPSPASSVPVRTATRHTPR